MTEDELKAIEERARRARWLASAADELCTADVPALVAEVRRLWQRVEDLEDAVTGVDDAGK